MLPDTSTRLIQTLLNMEQASCPVGHSFVGGNYIRELSAKAGTFLIGHKQKTKHINVFMKGKVLMYEADGTTKVLTAPMCFEGQPGRKVGLVLEDMVWLNIYATDKRDINEIEEEFLDKSIEKDLSFVKLPINCVADHASYRDVIARLGFTEAEVQSMVYTDNVIELDSMGFKIDTSAIHGKGIFATKDYAVGDYIGPMRIEQNRTILGRYTNHGHQPNVIAQKVNDMIIMVATKAIKGCIGGQNGDEILIDYEHTFKLSMEDFK